jgi:hypothetical protein
VSGDNVGCVGWTILAALFIGGFWWLLVQVGHWEEECYRRGGHTKLIYKSTVCLTSDGRILEL